jgi:uncharacterized membrane protein YhaH (DUF805 family)
MLLIDKNLNNWNNFKTILYAFPFELILVPSIIKRFHDMNKSAKWWVCYLVFTSILSLMLILYPSTIILLLYGLLFLIGIIINLFLLFKSGTKGVNNYGEEPKNTMTQEQ